MDDMTAFERQVAGEFVRRAGPVRPVDAAAIFTATTATQSPKWRFGSMFSATKFVVAGAIVALFGGFLLIAQPFEQQGVGVPGAATGGPGTFSPAGTLSTARRYQTATLLSDGRVLVIGGNAANDRATASAEVWDPVAASFSPAGSLAEPRTQHTATLLPDGRVLVVGGWRTQYGEGSSLAEVWDPVTTSFSPAGSLAQPRENHTATLLTDGRVLVIGGAVDTGGRDEIAEVWDPQTASFSPAGMPAWSHHLHTATLLPDGRVLVVGGKRSGNGTNAEVWDPTSASFEPAGTLAEERRELTATLLPDGRVLIVGGWDKGDRLTVASEVWDPATNTFGPAAALGEARRGHTATLLPDGRVLVAGGSGGSGGWDNEFGVRASAEVWDPETASFGPAGSLAEERRNHTATPLPDGRVLIVGGIGADSALASAEVWSP